jgi:hypothetical protein
VAEGWEARVEDAFVSVWPPMDGKLLLAFDRDRAAQAVNRQSLGEILDCFGFDIEKEVVAIGPDEEIEQGLALGGEQSCPHRQRPRDVTCDEALEEIADAFAR